MFPKSSDLSSNSSMATENAEVEAPIQAPVTTNCDSTSGEVTERFSSSDFKAHEIYHISCSSEMEMIKERFAKLLLGDRGYVRWWKGSLLRSDSLQRQYQSLRYYIRAVMEVGAVATREEVDVEEGDGAVGKTLVVSGDGHYYSKDAIQVGAPSAKKNDKVEEDSDDDSDDEDDDDESDEEMEIGDADDDSEDDESDEDEETPVKSAEEKKRPAPTTKKSPESKKAKLATPQNTALHGRR